MKRVVVILLVLIFFLSCKEESKGDRGEDLFLKEQIVRVKNGVKAPDFELENIEGDRVSLKDYKEKVLFINFWASWCGPCVYEMPAIARLHNIYKEVEDVEILLINLGEDRQSVDSFLKEGSYTIPTLLDSSNSVGLSYGVRSIPTTVIVGKDGMIKGTKVGAHEWDNQGVRDILDSLR